MHEVLVNRLGGLSLSGKSVVRLTDCPDMTLDVNRGRKTTIQQHQPVKQLNEDSHGSLFNGNLQIFQISNFLFFWFLFYFQNAENLSLLSETQSVESILQILEAYSKRLHFCMAF